MCTKNRAKNIKSENSNSNESKNAKLKDTKFIMVKLRIANGDTLGSRENN